MKLKKALKTLEAKETGFVFKINEMSQNYNPEKFVEEIQTYGYTLFYEDEVKKVAKPFKLFGTGFPYQSIEFLEYPEAPKEDDSNDWGYYTFTELFKKFSGTLPLNFGFQSVVHKSTEASISLYHT